MSFVKYSIGQITSVSDKKGIENREDNSRQEYAGKIAVCKKCGLQHLIKKEAVCACGNKVSLN